MFAGAGACSSNVTACMNSSCRGAGSKMTGVACCRCGYKQKDFSDDRSVAPAGADRGAMQISKKRFLIQCRHDRNATLRYFERMSFGRERDHDVQTVAKPGNTDSDSNAW